MAGLPKKYAKLGFKKGWKAFKRSKSNRKSISRRAAPKRAVKRTSRRSVNRMARRRSSRRSASKRSSKGNNMKPITARVVGGFGYGLLREPLSMLAAKVPVVGGLGDEIALGAVAAYARTRLSGVGKKIADAALTVEASRLGAKAGSGALGGLFGAAQPAQPSGSNGNSGMVVIG